jgi:hypothetical protein
MISQDDIDAFNQEKLTHSLREDIVRALRGVQTAMHYMAETSHHESQELDDIADDLESIKFRIRELLK